jgi:RimJ/RimL family protein N-acetyltransferase
MSAVNQIVTGDRVARFVGDRNAQRVIPPYTALGVECRGDIIAGAVFRNYTRFDIEVMVVGELKGFTPGFVRAIGRYVFDQLECERLSMWTDQPRVIALAERLGAQFEGVKRNGFGKGRDATLIGVLRADWKFK